MITDTVDKELMWDLLSDNHGRLVHAWGQELQALSKKRSKQQFHSRAEECLKATLNWPNDARARAVKTWLSTYQLPLDPKHMDSFDQFHTLTGQFILNNIRAIKAYHQVD
jgi:hypothetical protein